MSEDPDVMILGDEHASQISAENMELDEPDEIIVYVKFLTVANKALKRVKSVGDLIAGQKGYYYLGKTTDVKKLLLDHLGESIDKHVAIIGKQQKEEKNE